MRSEQSIPQTRQHYQNIVLGIAPAEDAVWREEWEMDGARGAVTSPRSAKGKERERARKRVSSGAHT
tara:strand:+ start:12110 stop:12310 length:201 start_codon:yes stop_codon:yes gene_type:complete